MATNIKVLDCTLRDGGYCNQWRFGSEGSKRIVEGLVEAGIDIIECGFITPHSKNACGVTKFSSMEKAAEIIPENRQGKSFVVMANYGELSAGDVPVRGSDTPDGIRIAFHKKDRYTALDLCRQLKRKDYDIFIQAMVSISYTDEEFLEIINLVNDLKPFAFYIVDSFGLMKRRDMLRFFYLVDHNLNPDIPLGFHSHNNMQLAYANAQTLVDLAPARGLIIDSSVFGMGRGAGNLCTELLIEYLNDEIGSKYNLKPILALMDSIIGRFYNQQPWGYSLPNYLSASHNSHPNYAGYFDDKKTLTVENIDELFTMMDDDKRFSFDKTYAEELYLHYMETRRLQESHKSEFVNEFAEKSVLLVAPGKSSVEEQEVIKAAADDDNVMSVSVNFDYPYLETDFIFISNLRRFRDLTSQSKKRCIATSNLPADGVYLQVDYRSLLCDVDYVRDNAGLMAVRYFIDMGAKKILLAGFDGYSHDQKENYGDDRMETAMRVAVLDAINEGVSEVLKEYSKRVEIEFITSPRHLQI